MSGGPLATEISSFRQELAAVKRLVSGIEITSCGPWEPKLNLKPFLSLKCSGLDQVGRDSPGPPNPSPSLGSGGVVLSPARQPSHAGRPFSATSSPQGSGRCESGPFRIFGRYLCCKSRATFNLNSVLPLLLRWDLSLLEP